jgi:hypothetical protein
MGPEIPQPGEQTSRPGHSPQVGDIDVSVIPLSPSSCRNPANKAAWLKHGKGRGADQGIVVESFGSQEIPAQPVTRSDVTS